MNARISAVATAVPPNVLTQSDAKEFARAFFRDDFEDIDRNVFQVTYEWEYTPKTRKGNRVDVVFLVNGIPVAVIENKNPKLAGKVAVAFTIDPAGGVAEANVTETTLGSSAAENCMISRIRRWKFPEPKGGGVVAVTYPWLFSPAGE